MFDTHTHLTDAPLADRLSAVLQEARQAGVERFLIPGYRPSLWEAARDIAAREGGVYFAVGTHPLFAAEGFAWERREALLADPRCLAIGECGLDYVPEDADRQGQAALFVREAALAAERGKPLLVHCRKAHEDLLAILRDQSRTACPAFVLHSCSCSREQVRPFLDLGAYVSFSGSLTRRNARKALALAAFVPRERVLLETDSPYIGTDQAPPPGVAPRNLPEVLLAYAAAAGLAPEAAEELTDANARRFLKAEL